MSPDLRPLDGSASADRGDLVSDRSDTAAPADAREAGGADLPLKVTEAGAVEAGIDLGRDLPRASDTPISGFEVGRDLPPASDTPVSGVEAGRDTFVTVDLGATPDAFVAVDTCVPSCAGKYCGESNGCGGSCPGICKNGLTCCSNKCVALGSDPQNCGTCGKSCGASGQCSAGNCSSCTPSCTGKSCGSDGCGGLCGAACSSLNPFCIQGSCQSCVPSCPAGAACGDSDGCGGRCQGTCANGTCTEGICSTCTPSCTGKTCGDPDGCGGKCKTGSCPGGGSCGADGTCGAGCVPNCTGKLCGNNGCGGSCGNCAWPEICGDRSVLTTPTWTCIDQSMGCSTGVRSGFKTAAKYPEVAGCTATLLGNNLDLRKARTGKWCGNANEGTLDFDTCQSPEDACSPGWHICGRNGAPRDITDRLLLDDCLSTTETAGGTFVAALSPIDLTSGTCCPASVPASLGCPSDTSFSGSACESSFIFPSASPAACGQRTSRTSSCSGFGGWSGAVPISTSDGSCGSKSFNYLDEGVLCCKDPIKASH